MLRVEMEILTNFGSIRSIADLLLQTILFESFQFVVFKCHVLTLSHFE